MERTLILIKPDAVQRGLAGSVLNRFERKGLKLVGVKMMQLTDDLLKEHYSHIADKPFFPGIANFMKSSPVIAVCVEGLDCVETVRRLCGVTKAREAAVGTIRGDFAMSIQTNIVHASDSLENAKAEVKRFFQDSELFSYDAVLATNVYSSDELG